MAGRAGRRGLDEKGTVLLFQNDINKMPNAVSLDLMINNSGEQLESKFRLTYKIILNLLTAQDMNIIEMMKRSYGEHHKFSKIPMIL